MSAAPPHADVHFHAKGSPEAVLLQLRALHDDDKAAEKSASTWSTVAVVSAVAGVIAFFLGPVAFVGVPLGIAGLAVGLYKSSRAQSQDVEDRKLMAVGALLSTFGEELRQKSPLAVSVDFKGYTTGRVANGKHSHEWLRLQGAFVDGTQFSLRVTTVCKRKERQKRKYKKVKDTLFEEVDVELKLPRGAETDPARAERVAERVKRRSRVVQFTEARISGRKASFRLRTPVWRRLRGRTGWSLQNPQQITSRELIWSMVQGVQAARAAAAKPGTAPQG